MSTGQQPKFCTTCGAALGDDAAFCTECGAPVKGARAAATDDATQALDSLSQPVVTPSASSVATGHAVAPGTTAQMPSVGQAQPGVSYQASNTQQQGGLSTRNARIILIAVCAVVVIAIAVILLFTFVISPNTERETVAEIEQNATWSASQQAVGSSSAASSSSQASSSSSSSSSSAASASQDYMLPDSATRLYEASELKNLTDYELFIARNEIYARHGRMFKKAELNDYFRTKGWYTPTTSPEDFNEGVLNEIERKNATTIQSIEQARNSQYLLP